MQVKINLKILKAELPGFLADFEAKKVDVERMARMKAAWINPYSANLEYCCAAVEELIQRPPKSVLECGSGFTSLLLVFLSKNQGYSLCVLEDSKEWHEIVVRSLRFLELPEEGILHCPLRRHGDFEWYDTASLEFEGPDFVICDGPRGDTPGGRYGLLPVMSDKLKKPCTVLLDDAERPGEKKVLSR